MKHPDSWLVGGGGGVRRGKHGFEAEAGLGLSEEQVLVAETAFGDRALGLDQIEGTEFSGGVTFPDQSERFLGLGKDEGCVTLRLFRSRAEFGEKGRPLAQQALFDDGCFGAGLPRAGGCFLAASAGAIHQGQGKGQGKFDHRFVGLAETAAGEGETGVGIGIEGGALFLQFGLGERVACHC